LSESGRGSFLRREEEEEEEEEEAAVVEVSAAVGALLE